VLEYRLKGQLAVVTVGQHDRARLAALETNKVVLRAVAAPLFEEGRTEAGVRKQTSACAIGKACLCSFGAIWLVERGRELIE